MHEQFRMNKALTSLIVATLSWSGSVALPATNAANSTPNKASHTSLKAPRAIAGFCAGVVVGTPVCFVRKLPHEISEGGHGLAGSIVEDSNNKFVLVPATLAWSPFACVVALIQSPASACKNAWEAQKPFSKEQFSLEWLEPAQSQPNK